MVRVSATTPGANPSADLVSHSVNGLTDAAIDARKINKSLIKKARQAQNNWAENHRRITNALNSMRFNQNGKKLSEIKNRH
ncbi:hypothetical protein [Mycoplasma todarodis]|uniref:Uncharacterized protein n=1 Tax=Mycoplasma todarodis TaxID=1937191 RepID=A0A4R0XPS4_9MOLU|nr:hypothetical protein [Mycoplasma todarodis]TCG10320.1 hypothetical protein C4B25_04660 [Mycoplasma todarodis]